MNTKTKKIVYLVAAIPASILLYFVFGFCLFIAFGDELPPISFEILSLAFFVLLIAVNILLLKRFKLQNRFTLTISIVQIVGLYILGLFF